MNIIQSPEAFSAEPLCLRCFGRCFAKLGHGLSNLERGLKILHYLDDISGGIDEADETFNAEAKKIAGLLKDSVSKPDENEVKNEFQPVGPENCWLCEGLMGELQNFAEILSSQVKDYEFNNFLVGSKVDSEILAREESLWQRAGLDYPESIKVELNREVGKLLNHALGKPTEFSNPEIVALIDTRFNVGKVESSPLFFYGRYVKLSRGIPQTKWFCKKCNGRGCSRCNNTGKMYETSVEELIGETAAAAADAENFSLHGNGREDIDVLMLGDGRPFVFELSRPKKRNIDFDALGEMINEKNKGSIEVRDLRSSDREEMIATKMAKNNKIYRCKIQSETTIPNEKLKMVVNTFVERVITQKTPIRVIHRRTDKIRKRKVVNCKLVSHDGMEFVLDITGESGLYIKELIHGDDARTQPNFSDELGIKCEVISLDVLQIIDRA